MITAQPIIISIKDVAAWDLERLATRTKIRVGIPALQRGLVWSPDQVELLWDSILRGFPIGSLVVNKRVDHQARHGKTDVTHHLLDGQQRANAIALGFHDPFAGDGFRVGRNTSESILWLDLLPQTPGSDESQLLSRNTKLQTNDLFRSGSTREFLIRVTTLAHPWGYQADDNASRLNAQNARDAIDEEYHDKPRPERRPSSRDLFPWYSIAPVPMSWLMGAIDATQNQLRDQGEFWDVVKNRLNQELTKYRWPALARELLGRPEKFRVGLDAIYGAVRRAVQTQLVLLEAPQSTMSTSRQERSERGQSDEKTTNIEHLFNRLNRQGTPLDGEELAYSMIKAYWPGVADVIDGVKSRRIPASRLASLGVRVALTQEMSGKFARPIGIPRLRAIARAGAASEDDTSRRQIEQFMGAERSSGSSGGVLSSDGDNTRLAKACETVDTWLNFHPVESPNGLPPVLLSSVARVSPDVYLLLLYLADRLRGSERVRDCGWKKLLPGLTTLIHWFAKEKKLDIVDTVLEATILEISPHNVVKGLGKAIKEGLFIKIRDPDEMERFIQLPEGEKLESWNWYRTLIDPAPDDATSADRESNWWPFLNATRHQRELVLYAQRSYLGTRFPDYDPSRKDLWETHNRPWDFDHIHASYYFYNKKSGGFAPVCREWGYCIGNLRAWPFEENRSDRNVPANEKLASNDEMKDSLIESVEELNAFSRGDDTRSNAENALALCKAIKARFIRIYRNWYESAEIAALLTSDH